jgi:Dinucleotide-utilizing enzymes involved in molybdopterin and thiamine biosynthesis family 1
MADFLSRTEMLIGREAVNKLAQSTVAVFGIGGVGSYIVEALARAGVGRLILIDADTVAESNINRQLIALTTTVGEYKTDAAKERVLSINPSASVEVYPIFYSAATADSLDFREMKIDYIADAIDTVTSKLLLIERAKEDGVRVISSMGTGNKLDPTRFRVSDISATSVCPLARVMRRELKDRGIKSLKVLWSDETPRVPVCGETDENASNDGADSVRKKAVPTSISFVPSVAGLIIAGEIIKDIAGITTE